jgi:hypothetical protein
MPLRPAGPPELIGVIAFAQDFAKLRRQTADQALTSDRA